MSLKPSTPIGTPLYAPLLIRLAIGTYFVLAGLAKLEDPQGFVNVVLNMKKLPPTLGTLYAILLPWVEIAAGGLFLIGLWTVFASMVLSAMLLSFIVAFGIQSPAGVGPFNKDLILLAGAASIMYLGGGAFSVDSFRGASSG